MADPRPGVKDGLEETRSEGGFSETDQVCVTRVEDEVDGSLRNVEEMENRAACGNPRLELMELNSMQLVELEENGLSEITGDQLPLNARANLQLVSMHNICAIIDSIPGARTLTNPAPPKLKLRDHRKIYIQETLSIKFHTFSKSHNKYQPKLSPPLGRSVPTKPTNPNPCHPKKPFPTRFSSPKPTTTSQNTSDPKPKFTYPILSPEWIQMMDRSMSTDDGQPSSSKNTSSKADEIAENVWKGHPGSGKTIVDMIKARPPLFGIWAVHL